MVRFRKMEKKLISISCSIFLFIGAVITAPFSIKEVHSAEIGLVGALAGETTLWEIACTIFAGAGLIIANEDIQSEALNDLAGNSYTLDSLVQSGKINVPEGGSSALDPEDWDWSGLENDLANNASSSDRKIIEGVFGQTGNNSPGGGDDNDPWFKKFVRWVKSGVQKGAYLRTQYINTNNGQLELGLASIASAISGFFQNAVSSELPVLEYLPVSQYLATSNIGAFYYVQGANVNTSWLMAQVQFPKIPGTKYFIYNSSSYQDQTIQHRISFAMRILNISDETIPGGTINGIYEYQYGQNGVLNRENKSFTYSAIPSGQYVTYSAINVGRFDTINNSYGSGEFYNDYRASEFISISDAYQEYVNSGYVNKSPDLMTPNGNAQNTYGTVWTPSPYVGENKKIDIIPQPTINNYITTINDPDAEPTPEYVAEVWTNSVGSFVGDEDVDPEPSTAPNPNITTVPRPNPNPNVTPIPDVEPGGNDNPITVTEPDPMPVIEGGNADLPQIWDFFPFCIPQDIVELYKLFEVDASQRMAPSISWRFYVPDLGIDYTFNLNLSAYNDAAAIFRKMFLLLFIVSLLVGTRNLIWR